MKRYCLNLEDLSNSMTESLKSFFKKTSLEGKEKCEIKSDDLSSNYTCKITGKMCVANLIRPVDSGKTIEYNEGIAERCPCYIPPED